jgi:predicted dinucleotide-binding enzyme
VIYVYNYRLSSISERRFLFGNVAGRRQTKNMRIGILGSGDVAKSLGVGFRGAGHEVMLGSREPQKLASWIKESSEGALSATFEETARFGEVVALAVHGTSAVNAVEIAGIDNFKGKVVLDATNPLDMSAMPPKLVGGLGSSSGELIQKALPAAFVVKAFNTVGNAQFYKPEFPGGPPDMFICGNDANAKEQVSRICKDFGWNPIDVGGIELSHYLEATAMVWIITAFAGNHWNQAFKLLRKE